MPNALLDMVDAMLLPDTVPHDIVEIGRMAEDGSLPGPSASIDQVKEWLTERSKPKPKPTVAPVRHARKNAIATALSKPMTPSEIINAGKPSQPTFVINMPEHKESPAMLELAKSLGKTLEKIADNASKPAEPAKFVMAKGAIQIDNPVTIAKDAVNVEIKPPPPAKITVEGAKIDVHVPKQPKIKDVKRDSQGNMIRPIYEDEK